jgi:hypothetical protein
MRTSPTTKSFGPSIELTITVRNGHPCHVSKSGEEPYGSPPLGLYVEGWVRWIKGIAFDDTPTYSR